MIEILSIYNLHRDSVGKLNFLPGLLCLADDATHAAAADGIFELFTDLSVKSARCLSTHTHMPLVF